MTAFGTTGTAIEAMRLGAFDYILKPLELDEISELVAKGLEAHKLRNRAVAIPALSEYRGGFGSDHRQEQGDAGGL